MAFYIIIGEMTVKKPYFFVSISVKREIIFFQLLIYWRSFGQNI